MADIEGPAAKLARLLENADPADRQEITAWLLSGVRSVSAGVMPGGLGFRIGAGLRQQLPGELPAGTESQLVTVRFPAEQHERLRGWCTLHGFTMAAVVRGLVDRFLEGQEPKTA